MERVNPPSKARQSRQRAAIACRWCNSKRIKCDAASGSLPCANCKRTGRKCTLIDSRRGQRRPKTLPSISTVLLDQSQGRTSSQDASIGIRDPVASVLWPNVSNEGKSNVHFRQTHEIHTPIRATPPDPQLSTGKDQELPHTQGHFVIPKSSICLELFRVYFTYVAPQYPIIDREAFIHGYAIPQRPPSWLLLQAILFAAAGHCEETLLKEAGFESRSEARLAFFQRAKALFDADHEKDKITIIQSVFLMSFWWASPVDSKDAWHWLGIAINLALAIGLHRSPATKASNLPLKTICLRKRLWWSLYTEDKHVAAAFGRPVRLRLCDCHVKPLEMADFDGMPFGFGDTFTTNMPRAIRAYPICLASLSKIAELIVEKTQKSSEPPADFPALCDGMIQIWEGGLMEQLQLSHVDASDTIWPSMINIAAW